MSLRARINLLLTLLALAAAANMAALYLMNREVVEQHREVRATSNLIIDLSSLRYLALEYRLQQSERTRAQWESKHASLGLSLALNRGAHNGDQRVLFDRIIENHAVLEGLFAQVATTDRSEQSGPQGEHQERITRQILTRLQHMIDDCTRLSRLIQETTESAFKQRVLQVISMEVLLVMLVALLVAGLQRGMMRPLSQLLDAAHAIAEGKTEVRLPPGKDAEFALVFSSFNHMARNIEESLARLQEANQALILSNQDLSRFAYVASHDLQTPLRGIAGFVQLIEADYGHLMDDEGKAWLKRVLQSTRLLQMTIHDLLTYSRLDSNPAPLEQVPLDNALASARLLLESSITESGAVVESVPLPAVLGDENQLVQLFQNLINNAIKFRSEATPRISITLQEANGLFRISVKDNGIGIPEPYQKKVFEMFQRLHTQSRYPGTGIGLTICQRIMQRHGGDIQVESDGVSGSTFILDFPQADTGRLQ